MSAPVRNAVTVSLSVMPGASIYVDGEYKSSGNWRGSLAYGPHRVECRKESHRSSETSVTLSDGCNTTIRLNDPEPILGTLSALSSPENAEVWVDGKLMGHTPLLLNNVLIGNHYVEVKKNYFKPESVSLLIRENEVTNQSFQLESRVPVHITTSPGNARLTLNGESHETPVNIDVKEGYYNVMIPRQYNGQGFCIKSLTLRLDSTHTQVNIPLRSDNNYDYATFCGIDYDLGLQALGLNIGTNAAKHFMLEANFYLGLKKSETVYWSAMQTASPENPDVERFNYRHWAVDLRLGPTFWCGPYLRVSPELGVQYLKLRESAVDNSNAHSNMSKGGYVGWIGAVRLHCTLTQHIGLQITPQYRMTVSESKLPDASHDIDHWCNGFSVKAGLVFHFY